MSEVDTKKKVPNEYGIIDPQPENCNHNIESKNTSIVTLPGHRTFTYPEHVWGICKYCGKPFHYLRDANGKLTSYEEEEKEENGNGNE